MKRRYLIISMFLLPTLLTGCGQIRSIRLRRQLSLGNKYLLESDYEAAELAMKKAIEIDPKEMQAYLDLAEICRRRGDTAAAADILEDGWNESADISDTMSWQEVTARESVREELSKAQRKAITDGQQNTTAASWNMTATTRPPRSVPPAHTRGWEITTRQRTCCSVRRSLPRKSLLRWKA